VRSWPDRTGSPARARTGQIEIRLVSQPVGHGVDRRPDRQRHHSHREPAQVAIALTFAQIALQLRQATSVAWHIRRRLAARLARQRIEAAEQLERPDASFCDIFG